MKIREAKNADIPQIVELLKVSLGESSLPKSEAYWRWKHIDNPFGKSLVLLALEGDRIVGVRAFMQWRWKRGEEIYRSLRAVDTATHPEHQGKGVFRTLTLKLVELAKEQGFHFIFNTPNNRSKPGYLKMGWVSQGRYPVKIIPVKPLDLLFPGNENFNKEVIIDKVRVFDDRTAQFIENQSQKIYNVTETYRCPGFFQWRYLSTPGLHYQCCYNEQANWLIFFRSKIKGKRKELRICDLILTDEADSGSLKRYVRSQVLLRGLNFISIGSSGRRVWKNLPALKLGPEITFRDLTMVEAPSNWRPSIGDLELF